MVVLNGFIHGLLMRALSHVVCVMVFLVSGRVRKALSAEAADHRAVF